MLYLSETIPVYRCPSCLIAGRASVWMEDEFVGMCCGDCGQEVKWSHDEKPTYWSVAIYETDRSYGGPEEGGWWYTTGSRIDPHKQRVFEDITEALNYQEKLRSEYKNEKCIDILGFTERLPVDGYPARRPVYS